MSEIKCPKCDGAGTIEMPFHLRETMDYLQQHGPCTTREIYEAIGEGIKVTAMNNRMIVLESLGLVFRLRRKGKIYVWQAAPSYQKSQP